MTSTKLETPCRVWQGALTDGYGRRYIRGHGMVYVHRWVWEQINGPIPDGMCILHRCDNRPCFRFDHLFLGTRGDNARDMAAKGRSSRLNATKTHCPAGHPYDETNTIRSTTREGYAKRTCRICQRAAVTRYRAKRRMPGHSAQSDPQTESTST